MKVNLHIDKELEDIKVDVYAPSMTESVSQIIETIEMCGKERVYVKQGDEIYYIKLEDIICFYTDDKNVYLRTKDGSYKVKYRLYELEEKVLNDKFLRISNAIIVNEEHIKCFDTAEASNIIVKLDDGSKEYVSKRRIKDILKKLKEREI